MLIASTSEVYGLSADVPFREDGKQLDGDIIFKYPLKKAQDEGYFKPIHFKEVDEYDTTRADEAIAAELRARVPGLSAGIQAGRAAHWHQVGTPAGDGTEADPERRVEDCRLR